MRFIEKSLLFILFIHGPASLFCQSELSAVSGEGVLWKMAPIGNAECLLSVPNDDSQREPVIQCFGAKDGEGVELTFSDRPVTAIASLSAYNMLKPSGEDIRQQFVVSGFDQSGGLVPVRWLETPHTLAGDDGLSIIDPTSTPLTFAFFSPVKKISVLVKSAGTGKALSHGFVLQDVQALASVEEFAPEIDCDRQGIVFLLDCSSSMQASYFDVFREKLILFAENNRLMALAAGRLEIVPFDGSGIQSVLTFPTCDSLLSFLHEADWQKTLMPQGNNASEALTDYSVAIRYIKTRAPRLALLATDGYPNAVEGQYASGSRALCHTLNLAEGMPLVYFNLRNQVAGSLLQSVFKSGERASFDEVLKHFLLECNNDHDADNQPLIEVAPNPSSGQFTVACNAGSEMDSGNLKLLNSEGQIVGCRFDCKNGQCSGLAQGLSPGHYYVQYQTGKTILKAKLVIVH